MAGDGHPKGRILTLGEIRARRIFLVFLFVLFIGAIDPFGAKRALDQTSEDRFLSITSPFYTGWSGKEGKAPKITVVVIDEEDLRAFNYRGGFLGYRAHCDILDQIVDLKPAALFLDFDFHPRFANESAPAAASTPVQDCASDDGAIGLQRYAAKLYQANLALGGSSHRDTVFLSYASELSSVMTGIPRVDLNVLRDATMPNTYSLRIEDTQKDSPAWALFRALCTPEGGAGPCSYRSAADVEDVFKKRPEITLRTGRTPDAAFAATSLGAALGCTGPSGSDRGKFGAGAHLLVDQLFFHTDARIHAADLDPCIPIAHLNLRHLESPEFGPEAEHLIRGRIVMVGLHQALTGDRYVSPVHGVVPGVFVHAIALDNLLADGAHALHPAWSLPGHLDAGDVLTAAYISLATYLAFLIRDRLLAIRMRPGRRVLALAAALWWGLGAPLLVAFVSIFVLWTGFRTFDWSPSTWLGGSGSIFVALTIVLAPEGLRKLAETLPDRPAPVRALLSPLRAALHWSAETFDEAAGPEPDRTPAPTSQPLTSKGAAE